MNMKLQKNREMIRDNYVGYSVEQNKFWMTYNDYVNSDRDDIVICNIWGIGGVGKSRFCDKIRKDSEEREIPVIKITLEEEDDIINFLYKTRNMMVSNYDYSFPNFDGAYLTYKFELGVGIPEAVNTLIQSSVLATSISYITAAIGKTAVPTGMILSADNLFSHIKNKVDNKKYSKYLEGDRTKESCLQFCVDAFIDDFIEINSIDKKPFIFIIDGYEHVFNMYKVDKSIFDLWLSGNKGVIQNLQNVVWVVSERERLQWEKYDEEWKNSIISIELGGLSKADIREYYNNELSQLEVDKIYGITKGIPLYMYLIKEMLRSEKSKSQIINNLPNEEGKLVLTYLNFLTEKQKNQMYIMSCIDSGINENEILEIEKNCFETKEIIELQRILQKSIFNKIGTLYYMHEVIRDVLFEACPTVILRGVQNYFEFHKNEKAYTNYLRCKIQIINDNSQIMELFEKEKFLPHILPDKFFAVLRNNALLNMKIKKYGCNNSRVTWFGIMGRLYQEIGLYKMAEKMYRRCRINMEQIGGYQQSIIDNMHEEEANMMCQNGKAQESYEWRINLYKSYCKKYGKINNITINARQNVAVSLQYLGREEEALDEYTYIYELRKKYKDTRDGIFNTAIAILQILNHLKKGKQINEWTGVFLRDHMIFSQNEYIKLLEAILELCVLDESAVSIIINYVNETEHIAEEQYLEILYKAAIRYESIDLIKARKLLDIILKYRIEKYGENSLKALGCEMEIAICLSKEENHGKALVMLEELYNKIINTYGGDVYLAKAVNSNIKIEEEFL